MIQFEVRSKLITNGSNPELADMDNPNGFLYGEMFYVIATFADGKRFRHYLSATYSLMSRNQVEGDYSLDDLQRFANKLQRLQPALNPYYWEETEPCYGSPAWQEFERHISSTEKLAEV
jgi:hypothetical protein